MLKKLLLAACLVLVSVPAQAAFYFSDLACETTTTTGQGTLSLAGAQTNYISFATSGVSTGDTVPYQITSADGKFETGIGTYTSGAPNTLARTTVKYSSDGAATKLTLIAGTHVVCIGPIASLWTGGNSWTMDLSTTGVAKLGTIELGHATDTTLSRLAASRAGVEGAPIGLYTFASSAPSNPQVGDVWVDSVSSLTYRYINDGDSSQWVQTAGDIPSAVNPRNFAPTNVGLSVTASGSALTVALKTAAGADPSNSDPVYIPYRDSTNTASSVSVLPVYAATSVTVSSGSTLGVTSSQAFRIWILGCNDAGTFRLGVFNASDSTHIYPLSEEVTKSSTAEGGAGAADSAGVLYTGTAISSKSCRILGYAEWSSTGLTAGTWTTTALNYVQVFGPGVHLPGSIIQTVYTTSTTTHTTTSATFQSTGVSIAITPTSAANPIMVNSKFTFTFSTTANHTEAQMSRGTTNNTNMIGTMLLMANGTAGTSCTGALDAMDIPNTTSSQSYAIQHRVTNSTNGGFGDANSVETMIAQEIMG